jgi:hypothetical protein
MNSTYITNVRREYNEEEIVHRINEVQRDIYKYESNIIYTGYPLKFHIILWFGLTPIAIIISVMYSFWHALLIWGIFTFIMSIITKPQYDLSLLPSDVTTSTYIDKVYL